MHETALYLLASRLAFCQNIPLKGTDNICFSEDEQSK